MKRNPQQVSKPESRAAAHQHALLHTSGLSEIIHQSEPDNHNQEMTGPVAQAMMSRQEFIASTTNGENRKSITAIDNAIQAYETLVARVLPAPATGPEKIQSLTLLMQAVDLYIDTKVREDPTNTRIPPVRRFKQDVQYALDHVNGNRPTPTEVGDVITNEPNEATTRNWVIAVSDAPSMIPEVRRFITATGTQKKRTLELLHGNGNLGYVLDAAFVDGAGIVALRTFEEGNALNATGKAIHNAFMDKTATLAVGKEIMSRRFHIPLGNIKGLEVNKPTAGDALVQNEDDWTLPGLRRAYGVMTTLPDGHAADNANLQHIKRYTGGGGWHGDVGNSTLAAGYTGDPTGVHSDPRTLGDKIKGRGRHAFIGKNSLEKTVRHEVGHAVDARSNFSAAYCVNNAPGGNWTVFADEMAMVTDYLTRKNSPIINHNACNGGVRWTLGQIAGDNPNIALLKQNIINTMTQLSTANGWPFDPGIVRNSDVFEVMTRENLKKPYSSAAPGHANNRTYVWSSANMMSSYDAGARARQVSNYQFRSPQEWFAEAYAAFYLPDDSPLGHGSALQAADNATYQYFLGNVHRAL